MSETTINDASKLRIVDMVNGKEVEVTSAAAAQKPVKEKSNDKNQA